ncbi:NAD(P)/FAD-dependent oxidoreductase [Paucibacter sp. R3-3]|uniref:NAD(P)/FAD-dependent oxidoreductase n=1 Tax=Roseateles agri TaxID=3098619 RepID=A0ABU5DAW5_9BURK|nr:NAD(P)/FAD-dependent oxidoreductase [Paucibacter sp. R3-3]MDY0743405.1 NAD(P)/FAD-dependent oxidoreductase [Paucibacter sp. R3-3]
MKRRGLLGAAVALAGLPVRAAVKPRVLVVGGGYGGATAAKHLRLLSGGAIDVTLVEPEEAFVSCPMSNLVLEGSQPLSVLIRSYAALQSRHGVKVLRDSVVTIDPVKKTATLASGAVLGWDKLVLSPGVDMVWDSVEGLAAARGQILQAWKAGAETLALRRQLEAMPDGGVFAIAIPEAPYRCPPAPYERACLVAAYFKRAKPKSKVLVIDANEDLTSKGALFRKVWAEDYKGIVDYQPQTKTVAVDAATKTLKFEIQEDLRADVLNVLPVMRAGDIAVRAGLANGNARWVGVKFPDFESTAAADVHVIGDSIQIAPAMPKSGHMAMSQGKALAVLLTSQLSGSGKPAAVPRLASTCYSFVDAKRAMHIASEHEYVAAEKTYLPVHGVGGSSDAPSAAEGEEAWRWARDVWSEVLA